MRITMKALDTLHVSSVGPDCLAPGDEFTVGETDATSLEKRGLAVRTGEVADDAQETKTIAPLSAVGVETKRKAK